MIPVSETFTQAIEQKTRYSLQGEGTFEQLPVGALDNVTTTATQARDLSKLKELVNKNLHNPRYATLERNYWILNGESDLYDSDPEKNGETGYLSVTQANTDREFSAPPTAANTYENTYSAVGVMVAFDTSAGGHGVDFDIVAYTGGTETGRTSVRGNSKSIYISDTPIDGYDEITLEVYKWSMPGRIAKVTEFLAGIIWVFSGDDLVSPGYLEVQRVFDPISDKIPESRCIMTIDNRDNKYDARNPRGIWRYVEEGQLLRTRMGPPGEMITTGDYYVSTCRGEDGRAKFVTYNSVTFLDAPYPDGFINQRSFASILEAAFAASGITNYYYDPSLSTMTGSMHADQDTCRTLVRYVAAAAMMCVWETRDRQIRVEPLPKVASGYTLPLSQAKPPSDIVSEPYVKILCNYFAWTGGESPSSTRETVEVDTGLSSGKVFTVPDNPLINTEATALAVANFRKAYYLERLSMETRNWRQNPALDIADVINVEDQYSTSGNTLVTEQRLTYNGGLTGSTKMHGGRF